MIAVLQRVARAWVVVQGQTVGEIGPGLLVLVCAEQGDTEAQGDKLLAKILKLRIFSDAQGKMNLSAQDMDGAGTKYCAFVQYLCLQSPNSTTLATPRVRCCTKRWLNSTRPG